MANEGEEAEDFGDVDLDELAEALKKPPRAPKYGDGGNLELWDDEEGSR